MTAGQPLYTACCLLALLLGGGCATPTITTFDHAPDPALRQAKPFPATVAIMPWEDKREKIERSNLYALIPGVPFGVAEWQNAPGPEVEDRDFVVRVQKGMLGPVGNRDLLPLLARYFRDSGVFADVSLAGRPYDSGIKRLKDLEPGSTLPVPPVSADFVVMPVMKAWSDKTTTITYGLSLLFVVPFALGFPIQGDAYTYEYEWVFCKGQSLQPLLSKTYQRKVKSPWQAGGWGSWTYGRRRIQPPRCFFFQDMLPAIKADLEDFVRSVQKALPPPEDTAYWDGIAQARARRIAEAARKVPVTPEVTGTTETATHPPPPPPVEPDWAALRALIGEKEAVAVADLRGLALSTSQVQTLSLRVQSALSNTRLFDLLSKEDVESVLKAQKFERSGNCDETKCLSEMGKILKVEKIIGGTVGQVGAAFSLTLRFVDIETAKEEFSVTRDVECRPEQLLQEICSLANELAVKYVNQRTAAP